LIPFYFDPSKLQDPVQIQWWKDWTRRAERATARALDAFETWLVARDGKPFEFDFNSDVWGDLKVWLLEHVFYSKCAYCEWEILRFPGDAEHFRPKGAVKRKTASGRFEKPLCRIDDPVTGGVLRWVHPGYFWLAYDWRNLVPACQACNSGLGKNERFDVRKEYVVLVKLSQQEHDAIPVASRPLKSRKWPDYYYLAPADLDEAEGPLLLNPLNPEEERNPRKHIRFGVRGIAVAVDESEIGTNSIETLQLAEERLRVARERAQTTFRDKYFDAMRRFDPEKAATSEARVLLDEYTRGRWPFSAAAMDYYRILYAAQAILAPPD
jgi:hypothetical protein